MAINGFLIRWEGGWAYREDAASVAFVGSIEATLGLGALTSLGEAYRVADGQLAEFARERVQTDIAIVPIDASDTPYLAFVVGDEVDVEGVPHRVLGLTVTEEADTGRALFVPTLNDDVVLGEQERLFQAIRKMVNGTIGGRSKVAQPVVPQYVPRNVLHGGDCVCNPQIIVLPGPLSVSGNDQDALTLPDLCTNDMRAALTSTGMSADTGNKLGLSVRGSISGNYSVTAEVQVVTTDLLWNLFAVGGGALNLTTTTAGPLTPGDVVELEVQGTALEARLNGVPVLSATDSDVVEGSTAFGIIGSTGAGTGSAEDFTVETFCP